MKSEESLKHRIKYALRLQHAIRLVWHCAPGLTTVSYVLAVSQGLLPLFTLYLMKLIVDAVTAGLASPDKGQAFRHIALYIGLWALVAVVGVFLRSLAERVGDAQAQVVTDHTADVLHAKSVEVDLEYYENPKYYDTLHRAQQEASFRPTHIVNGLAQLGQSGISLLAMAGLLFLFHWAIAVILFVAALPGVFVRLRYAGRMFAWQCKQTQSERKAWYYHWMLTDGGYAKEIRLFNLGALFRDRFRALRKKLRREKQAINTRRSAADLAAQTGASVIVYGTYAYIAYRTISGSITLGDLVMYFQAFQRGLTSLQELLGGLAGLYEDNLFLTNYQEFMDLKPRVVEPSNPKLVPHPIATGIVFDHVSFSYPSASDKKVLQDIHFQIRPGEVVALVGRNGSGKTTLIKLLCRLYEPTSGSISIDGINLQHFKTTDLRREISVIFQDYIRYNLSARENIWLGNTEVSPSDERIETAAKRSGADQVVSRLPRGYDTVLGHWFEDGQELSVGEWQKLALARAFFRDAQIIVLDEPTSTMDAVAEYEVFHAFRQMIQGRTAILISHRFSTVKMADRIFVLEGGRIIESGNHEDLIRQGGTYARMFETQARSYR
jgi:ATP-binding cassette subfamily B protein